MVSRRALRPSTPIVRIAPSSSSFQVAYTIVRPSGEKDGNSSQFCSSFVTRRGFPSGSARIQSLPSAVYTTLRWSGETVTQRSIRTSKLSGATSCGNRSASVIVCRTRARNGITWASPVSTETFQILPPAQTTMCLLSGVHENPG